MSQAGTAGFSGFASVLFLSPPAWASLLKDLAAAEAAAEKEWEAADDKVNKELKKKGQREGVTLTILRDILESREQKRLPGRKVRREHPREQQSKFVRACTQHF